MTFSQYCLQIGHTINFDQSMIWSTLPNQQHHDYLMAVNRAHVQVVKTSSQSLLDTDQGVEVLKENKARVRGQVL